MDDVYMDSPVSEKDFELYEKLIADIGKTIEDAVNNDGLSLLLVFPALVSCICDVLGNIEVKERQGHVDKIVAMLPDALAKLNQLALIEESDSVH